MWNKIKSFIHQLFQTFDLEKGFHIEEEELEQYYVHSVGHYLYNNKTIIFMVDGRAVHGGLADRFKGIITAYGFSKKFHANFRIHYVFPFLLEDYLIPNKVDWRVGKDELIYNLKQSKPITVNNHRLQPIFHGIYVKRKLEGISQLHFYGNSTFYYNHFSEYFNQLFQPSEQLQRDIDYHLRRLSKNYISVTFRFQQLLGDFIEKPHYIVLPEEQRERLIIDSSAIVEQLHLQYPGKTILVTSDSISFLNRIKVLDFVYVNDGNVVHMDYTSGASFATYEKSFLDFYLIANAETIHFAYNDLMYHSGFAALAARVYNHPYKEIKY